MSDIIQKEKDIILLLSLLLLRLQKNAYLCKNGSRIDMLINIVLRVVVIPYVLVVAGTIGVVILEKRQPVKTLAWVLALISLPVVGVVLFYFFGQDIRKERMLQRQETDEYNRKLLSHRIHKETAGVPTQYRALCDFFLKQNYAPPFAHNDIMLFTSGFDKVAALIRDISQAEHCINIEYFIFEDDALGRLLCDCLIDAVKRGVTVRFLYDDVGCRTVKQRFYDEMTAAGVTVRAFMPVRFARLTRRVNYRNHRKIVVIDGTTGYVGGMNVAIRYLYGENGEGWRDMHLRIKGDAVYGLQHIFLADWFHNSGEQLECESCYPPIPNEVASNAVVQIVSASPASEWPNIMHGFTWAILNAKKYFYLVTPYFMPTEQVLNALQMAAGAGIDVRLMVTAEPDRFWLKAANASYYDDVLAAGVKIYAYTGGYLHAKYFVADDALSSVGSTNTDFRSFEDNFEVNAFIYDKAFAKRLRTNFENDAERCVLIDKDTWGRRTRLRKVCESFVRLLSPLL